MLRLSLPRGLDRRGFTLIEMLVVIAIITLVIAIILPVLAQMKAATRRTTCLSNHRALANAMQQYAMDNNGTMTSPRTEPISLLSGERVSHCWVNAWGDNIQPNADGVMSETESALSTGLLWTYLDSSIKAYKSPLDTTPRLRSYSINAYVGNVTLPDDDVSENLSAGIGDLPSGKLSSIPQPANTFCSIGEEAANGAFNKNGWYLSWKAPAWTDLPARWDGNKFNASFMDGSTQTLDVMSPAFLALAEETPMGFTEPGDPNPGAELGPATWLAVRQHLLPGRLAY